MKITMGYRRQKKEHDELMILSSWDRDIGSECVKLPLLSCFPSNASRSSFFSSPSPGRRLEGICSIMHAGLHSFFFPERQSEGGNGCKL